MALAPGSRLASYRIRGFVASGGMGDVYRAVHTELDRDVAIKVLSEEIAARPDAVRRFRREARAASKLNHPHICTVHDFLQEGELAFLVLEYLDGETLADRLARKPLKLDETLRYAAQLADGLDHAHGLGFVHRDLKPGNVMLTPHGAKILDFGLVKRSRTADRPEADVAGAGDSSAAARTGDPDDSTALTGDTVLGTLPYMAPEQVEAGPVDARTDIFALGVILYEMTTGQRPFRGATRAALAVDILRGEPPSMSDLAPETPRSLIRVTRKCMATRPEERWQSAGDLAAELRWIAEERSLSVLTPMDSSAPPARGRLWLPRSLAAALALALAAAVGALWLGWPESADPTPSGVWFGLEPPPGISFTEGARNVAVVSPDGETVAFVGTDREGGTALWIRRLGERRARSLGGTEGASSPFWSPDARSLGFFDGTELKTVRLAGGPVETIAPVSMEHRGGAWSAGGTILFAPDPQSELHRVPAGGGTVVPVTRLDRPRGEIGHLWPHFLPDGRHFLYFVAATSDSVGGIYLASLDEPTGRRIVDAPASGVFASGHVLYLRDGVLLARPFDPEHLRFADRAVPLLDSVATTLYAFRGAFSASENGVLAYSSSVGRDLSQLTWLAPDGQRLETLSEPRHQRNPSLSRDGRYLAVDVYEQTDSDILIQDLGTGRTRLVRGPTARARNPVWGPDGRSLAFAAERPGGWDLYRLDLHGSGTAVALHVSDTDKVPMDWSPDGGLLLFAERSGRESYDLLALPLAGGPPRPVLASPRDEVNGRLSPSGTRLAYISRESGRFEVYVQPFPATGLNCQVSAEGGYQPYWGSDDERLFYLDPAGSLMEVTVGLEEGCSIGVPRLLFETPIRTPGTARNHYVFSPETDRFLFNLPAPEAGAQTIAVLSNWPVTIRGTGG